MNNMYEYWGGKPAFALTVGYERDFDARTRGIIDVHLHGACLPRGAGLWNHLGSCRNIYV
jgi:hypothetical protein